MLSSLVCEIKSFLQVLSYLQIAMDKALFQNLEEEENKSPVKSILAQRDRCHTTSFEKVLASHLLKSPQCKEKGFSVTVTMTLALTLYLTRMFIFIRTGKPYNYFDLEKQILFVFMTCIYSSRTSRESCFCFELVNLKTCEP